MMPSVVGSVFFIQCESGRDSRQNEIHLLLNRHPLKESILRSVPRYEQWADTTRRYANATLYQVIAGRKKVVTLL
jgi:hypothetical protein